jgi:hypothetical protein
VEFSSAHRTSPGAVEGATPLFLFQDGVIMEYAVLLGCPRSNDDRVDRRDKREVGQDSHCR